MNTRETTRVRIWHSVKKKGDFAVHFEDQNENKLKPNNQSDHCGNF